MSQLGCVPVCLPLYPVRALGLAHVSIISLIANHSRQPFLFLPMSPSCQLTKHPPPAADQHPNDLPPPHLQSARSSHVGATILSDKHRHCCGLALLLSALATDPSAATASLCPLHHLPIAAVVFASTLTTAPVATARDRCSRYPSCSQQSPAAVDLKLQPPLLNHATTVRR